MLQENEDFSLDQVQNVAQDIRTIVHEEYEQQ